jgi:segregation and condensation protein A
MSATLDYRVDLEVFRGPLDLLLYLVKRNEVDICDIPMARIVEQFLDYLRLLELIDVERTGEFLVMAATLMEIKSKMLLPRMEESSRENTDPRSELVRQLLEYRKFKDAARLLEEQAERQLSRLPREPFELEDPARAEQPLRQVELWDLVSAFGRLMRETLALEPQQIVVDQTPLHVYMEMILERLARDGRTTLSALFTPPQTRGRLIGMFLAILELIRNWQIQGEQHETFGELWLTLAEPRPEPAAAAPEAAP